MAKTLSKTKPTTKVKVEKINLERCRWHWEELPKNHAVCGNKCRVCNRVAKTGDLVAYTITESNNYYNRYTNTTVIHKACMQVLVDMAPAGSSIDIWEEIRKNMIESGGI